MNKEQEIKKSLESVMFSLANCFEQESREKNKELLDELRLQFNKNEELYESNIILAFLNLQDFVAKPWLEKNNVNNCKNRSIIGMIYSGLFSHFVRKRIEQEEGWPFSEDKERFIINKVKKSIITGENNSLYATYHGCKTIDESKWSEQAYWSPKTFKDTDEVIEAFLDWYMVR